MSRAIFKMRGSVAVPSPISFVSAANEVDTSNADTYSFSGTTYPNSSNAHYLIALITSEAGAGEIGEVTDAILDPGGESVALTKATGFTGEAFGGMGFEIYYGEIPSSLLNGGTPTLQLDYTIGRIQNECCVTSIFVTNEALNMTMVKTFGSFKNDMGGEVTSHQLASVTCEKDGITVGVMASQNGNVTNTWGSELTEINDIDAGGHQHSASQLEYAIARSASNETCITSNTTRGFLGVASFR